MDQEKITKIMAKYEIETKRYLDMFDKKVQFSERDFYDIINNYTIEEEMIDHTRWGVVKRNIIRLDERYFSLTWEDAATESQEADLENCELIEVYPKDEMVLTRTWVTLPKK